MDANDLRNELEQIHTASFNWSRKCCCGDVSMAEEVLQNAYLKVLSGRAKFAGNSSLKTWFFGVIRNTAREQARSRQRLESRFQMLPEQLAETGKTFLDPRIKELRRLMSSLSARQQEVLHLVCEEELTIEDAAQIMGISVGSARQHYNRAKQKLRTLFEEQAQDHEF